VPGVTTVWQVSTVRPFGRGPEGFDRPLGCLFCDLPTEFAATVIGFASEMGEVRAPLRVIDPRNPVEVAVSYRVEGDGFGDAVVDHVGELPRVGEGPALDRGSEDLFGVVAGEFGTA